MTGPALEHLARFVAEDRFQPDDATLAVLRGGVIDTLGCIHAGLPTEVATRARAAVAGMGAAGPAAVIGTTLQVARPQAAFLNAVAGHALDFDDWEIPGNTHPTVVILPAILATSQSDTAGADVARAYLAGFEVIARLGEALNFAHYDAGWHSTATLGAVGAAAAAGRVLGLTAARMTHALSLAISAATGFTCQFGSHAKPLQAGFAARAGVEAACLAASGLTAQPHVLDHPRGMAALMGGIAATRISAVIRGLGDGLALTGHGLVLKPWPSCGYTHRAMTCALGLRDRLGAAPVRQIDIHLPDFHARVLPFQRPQSRGEALFSLPFVIAMGLCRGRLTLADLADAPWSDPDIVDMMARVRVRPFAPRRPDQNYAVEDPDRLVLALADGRVLEEQCVYPTGAPQAPMSEAQLWDKFCANTGTLPGPWHARLRNWPAAGRALPLFLNGESTT